jgi:uncharacterized protein YybS (DUF2232 family)
VNSLQSSREWLAAALFGLIVLLSLILMTVPILFFIVFLLPVPFIFVTAKFRERTALATFLIGSVGWLILTGDIGIIYILTYAAIVGGLMGWGYRKYSSAWSSLVAGFLGSVSVIIGYIIWSIVILNVNWISRFQVMIEESIRLNQQWLTAAGADIDLDKLMTSAGQWGELFPFLLISLSVVIVALNHTIAGKLLRRWGAVAPSLPPVYEWQIPKSVVYYYIFSFIMSLFVAMDEPSIYRLFIVNILPILTFALAIQGISFIYYWAHIKNKGKWLPRLSVILLFVFPPIANLYNLIGILDLGFPLRKSLRG